MLTEYLPCGKEGIESFAAIAQRSHKRDQRSIVPPTHGGSRFFALCRSHAGKADRIRAIVDDVGPAFGHPQALDNVAVRPAAVTQNDPCPSKRPALGGQNIAAARPIL